MSLKDFAEKLKSNALVSESDKKETAPSFSEDDAKELYKLVLDELNVFASELNAKMEAQQKEVAEALAAIRGDLDNEISKKVALQGSNDPNKNTLTPQEQKAMGKYFKV